MHLVMFDIDGTLVDTFSQDGHLYVRAVRDVLGIEPSTRWESYRHVTDAGILDEIMAHHGLSEPRERIHAAVRARFRDLYAEALAGPGEAVREIPGAGNFLRSLLDRPDVAVALATGGWRVTASLKLEAIGLAPDTLHLATSDDAPERHRIMEIAAARALGPRAAKSRAYLGDGTWDQRTSRELGFDFVAIGTRVDHPARFDDFRDPGAIMDALGLPRLTPQNPRP